MTEGPSVEVVQYSLRAASRLKPIGAKKSEFVQTSLTSASGLPLAWVNGVPKVREDDDLVAASVRRTLDIVFSLVGLVALAPILVAIAIAIRMSGPGPVLFRQTRTGRNGRPFGIFKFRTLHTIDCDPSGIDQVGDADPRITPLGRLLRRTSLDELPQLLNVLAGEMAIIGPRPHVPGMLAVGLPYDEAVPHYHLRHAIKPGLSGWAQVNGYRGAIENGYHARARIEHDLAYIANRSLGLDLRIIWLTMWREVVCARER